MTSISNLQLSYASLQLTGQGNPATQAGGNFNSLLSSLTDCKGGSGADKKTYSVGNGMNIDMTAFGIDGDSSDTNSTDPLLGLINDLFDKIQATLGTQSGTQTAASQSASSYPFTSEFQSVFGTDGPLFNFIDATTKSLGLSADKNLALQNIAINNKDITKSDESVAKIRTELQAAGIA